MKTKMAVDSTLSEVEAMKQRYEETDKVSIDMELMCTPLPNKINTIVNEVTKEKMKERDHTGNKSSMFATYLHLKEANKTCDLIGIQLEFNLHELPERTLMSSKRDLDTTHNSNDNSRLSILSSTSSQSRHTSQSIKAISVRNKERGLIALWSIDKFEQRLSVLRNICEFYMEEKDQEDFSADVIFKSADYLVFIESCDRDWQSYDEFKKNDSKFSQSL